MGVRDGQRLLLPTVHVRPSAAPLIMQIRPHRCLLIRAGRVDPDVVAILTGAGRLAIIAVIITLIGTRPLPIICRKANLVRGAVIRLNWRARETGFSCRARELLLITNLRHVRSRNENCVAVTALDSFGWLWLSRPHSPAMVGSRWPPVHWYDYRQASTPSGVS